MSRRLISLSIVLALILTFHNCKEDEYTSNPSDTIVLSTDTVKFDTIFSTIGSVTQLFKVINPHDKFLSLSRVYVKSGVSGNFRINLDGSAGNEHRNIPIPPKDSLFIFVDVTIDPTGGNLPFVVYDAVVFEYNGISSEVTLEAFGQDVHLLNGEIIETETWTNDKPYLVYNNMAIDSNHVLTIQEGVKVHFHFNSSMIVWGNLHVEGTLEEPVIFEGDRFDLGYGESAGRWGTIFIHPRSRGNTINYAVIKNAQAGIQIGEPGDDQPVPSLLIQNTIIQNTSSASIVAFGAEITAYNSVFADAQYSGLTLLMGGNYQFYHSTVSMVGAVESYGFDRIYQRDGRSAGVFLSNWFPFYALNDDFIIERQQADNALTQAGFYNSIIYGNNKLELETNDNEQTDFNYYFDHCILKQLEDSIDVSDDRYFNNVVINEYPRFVNDSALTSDKEFVPLDFRLDTLSPAKDIGSIDIVNSKLEYLEYDFDGNLRTADGKPDLGAYERQE